MSKAAFLTEHVQYIETVPFNPGKAYPEYKGVVGNEKNKAYEMVRELFHMMKMDCENFGTEVWNPLSDVVSAGSTVLLKPNFVIHKNESGGNIWAVITHPSIIRAVADYAIKAVGKTGRVIIADAPQGDCDFDELERICGLNEIVEYYRKKQHFNVELYDLRQMRYQYKEGVLLEDSRILLNGDPDGYVIFDVGAESEHRGLRNPERIYGADYDRSEVISHHLGGHHEYCISKTVLKADVVISIPKMKTHRKNGVTLNFKNFIGINGNKNYLPHFRIGDPSDGGDEYEPLNQGDKTINYTNRFLTDKLLAHPTKLKSLIYKGIYGGYALVKRMAGKKGLKKSSVRGGAWYGNDTLWRTVADLNKIIEFGDAEGKLHDTPQRKLFCIIDGIIAGEGNGPLGPNGRDCGTLICSDNLLLADLIAIRLMDIDYEKVQLYRELVQKPNIELSMREADIVHNLEHNFSWYDKKNKYFLFEEADGWKNRIRISNEP